MRIVSCNGRAAAAACSRPPDERSGLVGDAAVAAVGGCDAAASGHAFTFGVRAAAAPAVCGFYRLGEQVCVAGGPTCVDWAQSCSHEGAATVCGAEIVSAAAGRPARNEGPDEAQRAACDSQRRLNGIWLMA
eukprot:6490055-Prymnesium_polylepis.1